MNIYVDHFGTAPDRLFKVFLHKKQSFLCKNGTGPKKWTA